MRNQLKIIRIVSIPCVAGLFACNGAQCAENYPHKPLRMVIPYTPGGPTDLVGRALAAKLQEALGQQVIVDNRSGGTGHLGMELLKQAAHIDMLHIPYKGTAPALTDMIAGQVQLMFTSLPSVQPHVAAGRLRLLATGAAKRTPAIPDTPTMAETMPGYELVTWYGVFLPARAPATIVARLHAELARILASPAIERQFAQYGVEPVSGTPQALATYMRAETERWGKVIRASGIRLD